MSCFKMPKKINLTRRCKRKLSNFDTLMGVSARSERLDELFPECGGSGGGGGE